MSKRTVRDVMTEDVASVPRQTPFQAIAELLIRRRIGSVPVIDASQQVVGVVSEADLIDKYEMRAVDDQPPWWFPVRRRRWHKAVATVAADLMSSPAITIEQNASVTTAARLLAKKSLKRVPVVDETGRLIGVLSRHDLVRMFIRTDADVEEEIREHVLVRGLCMDPHGVTVRVKDGVATLRGQVERRSLVPFAVHLTWSIDGVVDVIDELTWARDDSHVDDGMAPQNVGVLHDVWFKH